jgi:hypothetical protein
MPSVQINIAHNLEEFMENEFGILANKSDNKHLVNDFDG